MEMVLRDSAAGGLEGGGRRAAWDPPLCMSVAGQVPVLLGMSTSGDKHWLLACLWWFASLSPGRLCVTKTDLRQCGEHVIYAPTVLITIKHQCCNSADRWFVACLDRDKLNKQGWK